VYQVKITKQLSVHQSRSRSYY